MAVFQKRNPDIKLDIEISRFDTMLQQMKNKVGTASYKQIMLAEIGSVLSAAARRTKKAKLKQIIEDNPPPGKAYKKGTRWATIDGQKYRYNWKLNNKTWNKWQLNHKEKIKNLVSRIGLAQRMWVEIGNKLGIKVEGTAASAKAETGTATQPSSLVQTSVAETHEKFIVEIMNASKYARFADADQALFSAIKGRISYFEKNVSLGVFNDMNEIAKRYPGVVVSK